MGGRLKLPFLAISGGAVLASAGAVWLGLTRHRGAWLALILALIALVWLLGFLLLRRPPEPKEQPALSPGIEAIRKQLQQVLQRLGSTRGVRTGSTALEDLPWFLLLGPTASGKTTLLHKSGLRFPYVSGETDPREIGQRGHGGTKSVDWFVTDRAVVLDIAGRYLNESDAQEWLGFMDLLNRHCSDRVLNGLLVSISLGDLLAGGEGSVEKHAERIRFRIDQLIDRLGMSPPVYLVFAKCDLINGFSEFFAELTKTQRDVPWGATLSRERALSRQARELFDEEAEALRNALSKLQRPRLAQVERAEARPRVVFFPAEFGAVSERISRFVGVLFRETHQEMPLFRGFYFTSVTQEGSQYDPYAEDLLARLGLGKIRPEPVSEPLDKRSFFLEKLFSEVIFPESALVSQSLAHRLRDRRRLRRALGWCAAAVAAVLVWLGLAYTLDGRRVKALDSKLVALRTIAGAEFSPTDLGTLDALRLEMMDVQDRSGLFFRAFGLLAWQGGRSLPPARRRFVAAFDDMVVLPAFKPLCNELQANPQNLLDTIRALVRLNTLAKLGQDSEKADVEELTSLLSEYWAADGWKMNGSALDEATKRLGEQLEYARRCPEYKDSHESRAGSLCVKPLDEAIENVRNNWNAEALYPTIEDAGSRAASITVTQLLGPAAGLSGSTTVPGTYTREGWRYVKLRLDSLDKLCEDKIWESPLPSPRARLLDRYCKLYVERWSAFMSGVKCDVLDQSDKNQRGFLVRHNESAVLALIDSIHAHVQVDSGDRACIHPKFDPVGKIVREERRTEYKTLLSGLVPGEGLSRNAVENFDSYMISIKNENPAYVAEPLARILGFPGKVATKVLAEIERKEKEEERGEVEDSHRPLTNNQPKLYEVITLHGILIIDNVRCHPDQWRCKKELIPGRVYKFQVVYGDKTYDHSYAPTKDCSKITLDYNKPPKCEP